MKKLLATALVLAATTAQADVIGLTCKLDSGNQALLNIHSKYDSSDSFMIVYKGQENLDNKIFAKGLSRLKGGVYKYTQEPLKYGGFSFELDRESGEVSFWNAKYTDYDHGNCRVFSREKTELKF